MNPTSYEVRPSSGKRTCRYCPFCLAPVYKWGAAERTEIIECRNHGYMPRSKTLNSTRAHAEMQRRGRGTKAG